MFGVAPYVASQWLAAVALALKAAELIGDGEFIDMYGPHFERGRSTLESATWNGHYFNLHSEIRPDAPEANLGCMTDQILGEGISRTLGLPHIVAPEKADASLRAILERNYKPEQGLRNCQWPGDAFLHETGADTWIDQANTCWTGVELAFAAHLYYAGFNWEAEEIIRNVDSRHRRWGMYWDHQEFGGHYFRAMSALAIPNAFLGLSYDGETLRIAPARPLPTGRWCVLLPGAWGTFHRFSEGGRLEILCGEVPVRVIDLPLTGDVGVSGFPGNFDRAESDGRTIFSRSE